MLDQSIDLPFLATLVAANATPAIAARLFGHHLATPVDFGLELPDGQRLFGAHKSWRGFVIGVSAATLVGALTPIGAMSAAACGMLSLYGDLLSSFLKRRLSLTPGSRVPVLDHLPEAGLPLLATAWGPPSPSQGQIASIAIFVVAAAIVDAIAAHRTSHPRKQTTEFPR